MRLYGLRYESPFVGRRIQRNSRDMAWMVGDNAGDDGDKGSVRLFLMRARVGSSCAFNTASRSCMYSNSSTECSVLVLPFGRSVGANEKHATAIRLEEARGTKPALRGGGLCCERRGITVAPVGEILFSLWRDRGNIYSGISAKRRPARRGCFGASERLRAGM